jgi:hypothetical protein
MNSQPMKPLPPSLLLFVILFVAITFVACRWSGNHSKPLPYNSSNPVFYDNDEAVDQYTDEYLLARASLGETDLTGMITSSPVEPFNPFDKVADYERMVADREQLVANAKASGFANIPVLARGPMVNLEKPASGQISDTKPIGAVGSWLIVAEARKASAEKPLVVVAGAPLTAEADAYLLDPSIADKMVVAWLGGTDRNMCDYNGWGDPWAAYIVLQKLRLVQFPVRVASPSVPKAQLVDLPARPLRDYMYRKHHPTNGEPGSIDGDGPPAISLGRPDYPLIVRRVEFKGWVPCGMHPVDKPKSDDHMVPAFYARYQYHLPWDQTTSGRVLVVAKSDPDVATNEWWRAIRNALSN